MGIQISIEVLSSIVAIIGAGIAYREFKKNKDLNAIDKFISYRDKLKKDESLSKIISHVQSWQNDEQIKNEIPQEITLFDFYYFIGFYEEIYILIKKGHLERNLAKEMFAFYALEIANNNHYWTFFNEDYTNDDDWKNFRCFIVEME